MLNCEFQLIRRRFRARGFEGTALAARGVDGVGDGDGRDAVLTVAHNLRLRGEEHLGVAGIVLLFFKNLALVPLLLPVLLYLLHHVQLGPHILQVRELPDVQGHAVEDVLYQIVQV